MPTEWKAEVMEFSFLQRDWKLACIWLSLGQSPPTVCPRTRTAHDPWPPTSSAQLATGLSPSGDSWPHGDFLWPREFAGKADQQASRFQQRHLNINFIVLFCKKKIKNLQLPYPKQGKTGGFWMTPGVVRELSFVALRISGWSSLILHMATRFPTTARRRWFGWTYSWTVPRTR